LWVYHGGEEDDRERRATEACRGCGGGSRVMLNPLS